MRKTMDSHAAENGAVLCSDGFELTLGPMGVSLCTLSCRAWLAPGRPDLQKPYMYNFDGQPPPDTRPARQRTCAAESRRDWPGWAEGACAHTAHHAAHDRPSPPPGNLPASMPASSRHNIMRPQPRHPTQSCPTSPSPRQVKRPAWARPPVCGVYPRWWYRYRCY